MIRVGKLLQSKLQNSKIFEISEKCNSLKLKSSFHYSCFNKVDLIKRSIRIKKNLLNMNSNSFINYYLYRNNKYISSKISKMESNKNISSQLVNFSKSFIM